MRRARRAWVSPYGLLLVGALVASAAHSGVARAEEPPRVARAPVPLDGIVAIVEDVTIFRSDVAARVRHFEPKMSKDPRERRIERADLAKVMVGRLVDEVLIARDAAKYHVEVTGAEVLAALDTVAASNNMSRKQLDAEVASAGYSPADYQDELRRQILEQKWLLARALGKVDRKKYSDPSAFEAAIEKQRQILTRELRANAYVELR
jgi:parvulin-like peptidyl-prolyl isomerase